MPSNARPSQPSSTRGPVPGCVAVAAIFQDSLLEDPLPAGASVDTRRRQLQLEQSADEVCRSCPVVQQCLYNAVVKHDVAGFVAGTTARQRTEMRSRLGVTVQPEDFDTLAGVTRHHRQVNHEEVVRLRLTNPHESLEQLAQRLGCSLSTVKRHLRYERSAPAVREVSRQLLPTMAQVLAVCREVTGPRWNAQEAAA